MKNLEALLSVLYSDRVHDTSCPSWKPYVACLQDMHSLLFQFYPSFYIPISSSVFQVNFYLPEASVDTLKVSCPGGLAPLGIWQFIRKEIHILLPEAAIATSLVTFYLSFFFLPLPFSFLLFISHMFLAIEGTACVLPLNYKFKPLLYFEIRSHKLLRLVLNP